MIIDNHIQGRLITGLYSNNVGYVLAQVKSLVFRKQSARSKLLEYTILEAANTFQNHVLVEYTPEPFVDKILDSPPVPKHNLHYWNRAR